MRAFLLAVLATFALVAQAQSQEDPQLAQLRALKWQVGPAVGTIAGNSTVNVPDGYVFLDGPNTSRFLQIMGNPPKNEHYTLAPESLKWFVVFHFDPSGYVKDDETIDPEALLASLKKGDGPANQERKRLGMGTLHTVGWQVLPHYDYGTKRLEWGLQLQSESGEQVVNYTSRILGRSGVMSAILVSDPASLAGDIRSSKQAMSTFAFKPGQTYAEFRDGDKLAAYGLSALIVGGAAAAAAKTGLFKSLGKLLWVGVLGALAGIGALFKRLTGRTE